MLRSAPYFPVAHLERSVGHYERVFGFQRDYVGGDPPEFAIRSRDGLSIMLPTVPEPDQITPNDKQGGTWDVFFWVRDVHGLHSDLQDNGADVVYGPIFQAAYNMDEFAVRDSEGYVLGFGQARDGAGGER